MVLDGQQRLTSLMILLTLTTRQVFQFILRVVPRVSILDPIPFFEHASNCDNSNTVFVHQKSVSFVELRELGAKEVNVTAQCSEVVLKQHRESRQRRASKGTAVSVVEEIASHRSLKTSVFESK